MEYVPGVPLTKFADDKKLSLQQRLELFKDVCAAISHAHTKAIIHRDVKSSNVLAYLSDEKPFVKVIDFGIAKALTGDRLTDQTFNTDRGRAIGTFDSMSPEQAEGSPDIDTRTDVYSLGVLLYELLTGAPPFDRATLAKAADLEIRRIIREVEPPRPSTRLSSLGEAGTKIAASRREKLGVLERELRSELEWIPLMAMRKDRDRRYASPLEFSADIDNYLHGRPLQAGPEKVSYRVRKFLHRNKGKVAAAAAIVFLLVGGIISTSLGMSWAMRERAIAETARQSEGAAKDRAIASAQEARDAQARANQRALLVVQGQVSLGDALAKASRWGEAKVVYHKAYDGFVDLQASPLGALAASFMANEDSPPELLALHGHAGGVYSVAFSPDGHTLVTGSKDGTLSQWDLATGREIRTLRGHATADSVAVSPDGRTVICASDDHTIKLWDLASDTMIRTLTGHTGDANSVACSPDGRRVLSGSADKTLKLWDLATGEVIRTLTGHTADVCSVAISPDGSTGISGSKDGTIKVWNLDTGNEIRTIASGQIQVLTVAFFPDGRTAVSGGIDGNLSRWNLSTGKNLIAGGLAHSGWIVSVAVSPDGHTVLSRGTDNAVKIWNWRVPELIHALDMPASNVAFSPDSRLVAANDKLFRRQNTEIQTLAGHTGPVECVAFSPDGRTALSGSDDKTLTLWDLAAGKVLRTFTGHTDGLDSVAFSADGRTALSASDDKTLRLWDLGAGSTIRTFTGHTATVRCAVFSPDGRTALSGSEDKTLKLWDVASGKEIRTFTGHTGQVYTVAISPDGRTAISGSYDNTLKVWDLATGQVIRSINAATMAIMSVAFTPDGRYALAGGYTQDLSLWDLATGKQVRTMSARRGPIYTVAVSFDGHTVLAGNDDHTVTAWDLDTGKELCTLAGHTGPIWHVAFSPDGLSALSASDDKTLKLWDFARPARYWDFEPKVQQAQAALQNKPDDAAALAVLGEWYAFRGVNDWAVELLEKARAGGADVSSLTLARCYWNLNKLSEARREFQKAMDADEAPADYIRLCVSSIGQTAATASSAPTPLAQAGAMDLAFLGILVDSPDVQAVRISAARVRLIVAAFERVFGSKNANRQKVIDQLAAPLSDFRAQINPADGKVSAIAFAEFVQSHQKTPAESSLMQNLSDMRELMDGVDALGLSPVEAQGANAHWSNSVVSGLSGVNLVDANGKPDPTWLLSVLKVLPSPATRP